MKGTSFNTTLITDRVLDAGTISRYIPASFGAILQAPGLDDSSFSNFPACGFELSDECILIFLDATFDTSKCLVLDCILWEFTRFLVDRLVPTRVQKATITGERQLATSVVRVLVITESGVLH